jgi:hypothetical protein
MKKIKHSKFKNTGFLFELLVRQVTSDILSENRSIAERILKEYFNSKKELSKELKLYQFLVNEKYASEVKAEKFIDTVCEARKKLDEKKLVKEKYNLIKEIKSSYNIDDFVKSPISNYKLLASIYKIFENAIDKDNYNPVDILSARFTITETIINSSVKNKESRLKDLALEEYKKQTDDVRSITYKFLVEKFNEKYKNLTNEQKVLLREYINNINNTGNLTKYVIGEVNTLLKSLKEVQPKIKDKVTKIKLSETIDNIKKIKSTKIIKENHLSALMMAYELVKELKSKLK